MKVRGLSLIWSSGSLGWRWTEGLLAESSEEFGDKNRHEGADGFLEEQVGDVGHGLMVRSRGVRAVGEPRGVG